MIGLFLFVRLSGVVFRMRSEGRREVLVPDTFEPSPEYRPGHSPAFDTLKTTAFTLRHIATSGYGVTYYAERGLDEKTAMLYIFHGAAE